MLPVGNPVLTVSDQVTIFVMGQVEVPVGGRRDMRAWDMRKGAKRGFQEIPYKGRFGNPVAVIGIGSVSRELRSKSAVEVGKYVPGFYTNFTKLVGDFGCKFLIFKVLVLCMLSKRL